MPNLLVVTLGVALLPVFAMADQHPADGPSPALTNPVARLKGEALDAHCRAWTSLAAAHTSLPPGGGDSAAEQVLPANVLAGANGGNAVLEPKQ